MGQTRPHGAVTWSCHAVARSFALLIEVASHDDWGPEAGKPLKLVREVGWVQNNLSSLEIRIDLSCGIIRGYIRP
jgi:hypothetical protein